MNILTFDKRISEQLYGAAKKNELLRRSAIIGATYVIVLEGLLAFVWMYFMKPGGQRFEAFFELFFLSLFAWILAFSLEYITNRPRPYKTLKVIPHAYPGIETPSFPSSHASVAFTIAFWVFAGSPAFGTVLIVLASIVSISRVVTGVHYTTDILAGAFIGFIISSLISIPFL